MYHVPHSWTDPRTGETEAEIIGGLMEVIVWYEGMPDHVEVHSDGNFIFITKPNGESLSLLLHQGNLRNQPRSPGSECTAGWWRRLDA